MRKSIEKIAKELYPASLEHIERDLNQPKRLAFVNGYKSGIDAAISIIQDYYNKLHSWQDADIKDLLIQIKSLKA